VDDRTLEQSISRLLDIASQHEKEVANFLFKKEMHESDHPEEKHAPHWIMEEDMEVRRPFASVLRALYLHSMKLIGQSGDIGYLQTFYEVLGNPFDEWMAANQFDFDSEQYTPGFFNVPLSKLREILAPFNVESTSQDQYRNQRERLSEILCSEPVD